MSHDAAEIDRHVRGYIVVFLSLMVLTAVTVGIYYLHMNPMAAIVLALIVASIKATLVACFFMHLISEKKLIYSVLLLTLAFFVVLVVVPVLTSTLDQVRG